MSATSEDVKAELTEYEAEQVRQIAAWMSEPPNPLAEMFKMVTLPGGRVVEKLIPDKVVRQAIEKAYDLSQRIAGEDDVKRQAGMRDLAEMHGKPLQECDRLANRVSSASQTYAMVEGAATGAGGVLTTVIDIPLLFVLSLRTILKIGHCYGYPLDRPRDRSFVLGVLLAATSHTLAVRRERLHQLREIEDMLLEEVQEEILAEEAASVLFQLEIFEDVPGVGAVSGALLNLAFVRRVDVTARRVFQERSLRDHGKVDWIAPADSHARAVAVGWGGVLSRAAYSGCYYLSFGAALPAWLLASLFRPVDNVLTRGARDGAAAAVGDVDRVLGRLRREAGRPADGPGPVPALTPA